MLMCLTYLTYWQRDVIRKTHINAIKLNRVYLFNADITMSLYDHILAGRTCQHTIDKTYHEKVIQ
jgi:hypothetical protein